MNKRTILYTIVAILIVAATVGLVIWKVGQSAEQPILPPGNEQAFNNAEQPTPQGDDQILDNMKFDGLSEELQEIDGLIDQLQP